MAERRMFAKTIVLSDAFLDMPLSARALYMTLGMVADDDGFVNSPKAIMRQCGASIDDLNILLAKRFILSFDSGVIVIKHWRINNYLRNDRYQETKYLEEKEQLIIEQNGSYRICDVGIPSSGIPSIDKDSIDKNIDIDTQIANDFAMFWKAYPRKKDKANAEKAFKKVKVSVDVLINVIEKQKKTADWIKEGGKYIPYPATWLNGRRWEDEIEMGTMNGRPYIDISDPHSYDDDEDEREELFKWN